jgi:nucleoside-diphosphate-sugar epimerase
MPCALVTGGAGVMGARLVKRLLDLGWQVRVLVLPGDPLRGRVAALGAEIHEGDVSDAASLAGACAGVDTVYHLAAVIISHEPAVFQRINVAGTANVVAEASAARVEHLVYVSSASVVYPRLTPYAQSKLDAEAVVKAACGLAYTIVRPTLVYDTGGGQEIMMFLDYLRKFPVVPFIGSGGAVKRPVWAEDVVDGLVRIAGRRTAWGKTYNLSGAEPVSMLELAQLLLQHSDRPRPFLHLPVALCRALAWVSQRLVEGSPLTLSAIAGVINDADLDPSEAMRDLGYRPLGVREGFRRCFPRPAAVGTRAAARLLTEPFQKENVT